MVWLLSKGMKKNKIRQTNYQDGLMSYVRTHEHRARQSAAIQQWQPWRKSTGPKSETGKAAVAHNALKHGGRSAGTIAQMQKVRTMLVECKEFLSNIDG